MHRHADIHEGWEALVRANRTVLLGLFWAALAACLVSSAVYDVGHWVNAW